MDKKVKAISEYNIVTKRIWERLSNIFKKSKVQADNMNIILTRAIHNNNFYLLYEYLLSEIEFREGMEEFSQKIKIDLKVIKKFLHSKKEPNIVILSKILEGLGFKIIITEQ